MDAQILSTLESIESLLSSYSSAALVVLCSLLIISFVRWCIRL